MSPNPDQFREFSNLSFDGTKSRIPLPYPEYIYRSADYIKRNWLPLAGFVIAVGSQVIPVVA